MQRLFPALVGLVLVVAVLSSCMFVVRERDSALLFALGRYLIGLYLAQAAPGSAYGSMGALVLLLLWTYYAAAVFFAGALITAVIDERTHSRLKLRAAGL